MCGRIIAASSLTAQWASLDPGHHAAPGSGPSSGAAGFDLTTST